MENIVSSNLKRNIYLDSIAKQKVNNFKNIFDGYQNKDEDSFQKWLFNGAKWKETFTSCNSSEKCAILTETYFNQLEHFTTENEVENNEDKFSDFELSKTKNRRVKRDMYDSWDEYRRGLRKRFLIFLLPMIIQCIMMTPFM